MCLYFVLAFWFRVCVLASYLYFGLVLGTTLSGAQLFHLKVFIKKWFWNLFLVMVSAVSENVAIRAFLRKNKTEKAICSEQLHFSHCCCFDYDL